MSVVHSQKVLGDLLYANATALVDEREWVTLVRSIAAGDQLALHALYDMAHPPVFTLIMRLTANREIAEELVIDVFDDIWRRAAKYDAANGTVLSWIMNQARARALDALPFGSRDVDRFVPRPGGMLRPSTSLQSRLARRIAKDSGKAPIVPPPETWVQPDWNQVAAGIECKMLATDQERHRVSMLVRLSAGTAYPAHKHADVEELHLLEGELWIDGRKLRPGDYYHAAPGTIDFRVWSETGCMCVLSTSVLDSLR